MTPILERELEVFSRSSEIENIYDRVLNSYQIPIEQVLNPDEIILLIRFQNPSYPNDLDLKEYEILYGKLDARHLLVRLVKNIFGLISSMRKSRNFINESSTILSDTINFILREIRCQDNLKSYLPDELQKMIIEIVIEHQTTTDNIWLNFVPMNPRQSLSQEYYLTKNIFLFNGNSGRHLRDFINENNLSIEEVRKILKMD